MTFIYKGTSRELKKIITIILKSGIADNIKKFNYVQDYIFQEKNIKKSEEKILLIHSEDPDKLSKFLNEKFPQIEKININ